VYLYLIVAVDAIDINNGTFSWGTTDTDLEVLKEYVHVNSYCHENFNVIIAKW